MRLLERTGMDAEISDIWNFRRRAKINRKTHETAENNDSYKDFSNLSNFQMQNWLDDKNKTLVSFMKAVAGISDNSNCKKNVYIVSSIDNINKASNLTYVAPLQFCCNLITYYISGSKLISQIYNRQNAGGSYTTLQRWLKSISCEALKCNSPGDIVTFFDNNQIVAGNWRVTYGYKCTASVLTMCINIDAKLNSNIQVSALYSPRNWLYNVNVKDCIQGIRNTLVVNQANYDKIRNQFVQQRLQKVLSEIGPDSCIDDIHTKINGELHK
jgi:hypothetical protein